MKINIDRLLEPLIKDGHLIQQPHYNIVDRYLTSAMKNVIEYYELNHPDFILLDHEKLSLVVYYGNGYLDGYADDEARHIIENNDNVKQIYVNLFGDDVYVQGKLNRKLVSSKVFYNKELLDKVTNLIHPYIHNHFNDWCDKHITSPIVAYESAILFETGNNVNMDKIILVYVPVEERIERVMKRDNRSRDEIINIINKQLPDTIKCRSSNFIIDNSNIIFGIVKNFIYLCIVK